MKATVRKVYDFVSKRKNHQVHLYVIPLFHTGPESLELTRIDKYLDSWLNRTQFVKILTDSTVRSEFLQFVGLTGIRLKSFELFKTLAMKFPDSKTRA